MKYTDGQIIKNVEAVDLTYEGMGLVKDKNYSIFVENLLVGEKADIKIKKANNHFSFASVIKRYNDSPKRVAVENQKLMDSGCAPIANLSYKDQLDFKESFVKYLFGRNIHYNEIKNILGSSKPWAYRNKLTAFIENKDNKMVFGLYEKNTHNLIEQDSYDLALPTIDKAMKWLSTNVNKYHCFIDNLDNFEQVILRYSETYNQLMIVFVAKQTIELEKRFVEDIRNAFPELESLILINDAFKRITSKNYVKNQSFIYDKIGDLKFKINWNSFFQINSNQTDNLYNLLIDNIDIDPDDIVLDAYSGIGSISLKIAKRVRKVYGLEIISEAVDNARENAKLNDIKNTQFYVGNVVKTIDKIQDKINTVIVDPPRTGLSNDFRNKLIDIKVKQIGYISCNPHTLCRDVDLLTKAGYTLTFLKPCDMFCQTHHVECVAILKLIGE